MKILFLTHYFPPEVNAPATRTNEHGKVWVQKGHDVTVVTCAPNHPKGVIYSGYKNSLYHVEKKEGIKVIRLWTLLAANAGFLKRILNYLSYMFSAIVAAPFIDKVDIVISTSPQFFSGLAGYFVSRIKRVPWVLEIRDLWPDSIFAVGAIKNPLVIRSLRWLEFFAYTKADRIICVTDSFKDYMVDNNIDPSKIEVIKNGVDLDLYQSSPVDAEYKKHIGLLDNDFVAAYVGTHGMAHQLQTILDAAKILSEHKNIKFLMVGDGAEREKLLSLKAAMGLENVLMLDQQPKDMMPKIWSLTDVSVVLLKKSDLFKTVIPSKLFESMAMQKPIVLGVEGESLRMIEAAESGVGIEPGNAVDLAKAVHKLASDPTLRDRLGSNGRDYVEAQHDRSVLAERFLSVIKECLIGRVNQTSSNKKNRASS